MLCQFEKLVYPQNRLLEPDSYMVAIYRPCETIKDAAGHTLSKFKAVGYSLPTADNLRYEMQGHWNKNPKHGLQFEVDGFNEVIIPNKEGIVAYLSSGQLKGIGSKLAERIYDMFGNDSLDVLENTPEKLLNVSGITKSKLTKICDSYLANRAARDVVTFLMPYGITANRAVQFYKEYGTHAMDIVKSHPYQLCEISGIGFHTADKIAQNIGIAKISTERVDAGLLYTLADAEGKGHLCMEKHAFISECLRLLDTQALTKEMAANRAYRLLQTGQLVAYGENVYRAKTAWAEQNLANCVMEHLKSANPTRYPTIDKDIEEEENLLKVVFAAEQKDAVKKALMQGVTIITGGPGTGKTMIQRAILDIYHNKNPNGTICCCAPTGRAARRMEESTGYPASTVHKVLGLSYDREKGFHPEPLSADLVIVDEASMLDIYLAGYLFEALKKGSQIILVGDSDQLPSVGPGAVLSELIASNCIPTSRLDQVFRQNAGSRIAINAKRIRHGDHKLDYGTDFHFIESDDLAYSAQKIVELYVQEIAKYGVDNVALLSPYRQKTETGVNALNTVIRDIINPPDPAKKEIRIGRQLFRSGDKVMQIRNYEDVSNGDVGYIKTICNSDGSFSVYIDFGNGRIKEYDESDLRMLDLGYASTIHKSQGSEYKSVIINLQCAHYIMLTRPLIYTAVTRGKDNVCIVGERKALGMSVKRTDTEKRGTCLAKRLQEIY